MKPSELYEALHALTSERVPLHLWGARGVGKSQIVAQVAEDRKCDFLDIQAVQLDPVDLRGLPDCRDPARPERQVNVRVVPTRQAIEESIDLAHEVYNQVFRMVPEKVKEIH